MERITAILSNSYRSPITSLIGVTCVIGSVFFFWYSKISWLEMWEGIGVGLGFILLPDPKKAKKKLT